MASPVVQYPKPAQTPSELLAHLQSKGLSVPDKSRALEALQHIGYYRLLIYMRPLQDGHKNFNAGTAFEDVLNLYEFDRKLRLLCLDAVERIEVALRAAIGNVLTLEYGPHFYLESRHFTNLTGYHGFLSRALDAKCLAIKHYKEKYSDPELPPIWAVMEAVTFGTLSRLYSNLKTPNRKLIQPLFGYDETVLVSWFRSINDVRNWSAHHNRLWNSHNHINKPMIAKSIRPEFPFKLETFSARAVAIGAILHEVDPKSGWCVKLKQLIHAHPIADPSAMGFAAGWHLRPFWNQ